MGYSDDSEDGYYSRRSQKKRKKRRDRSRERSSSPGSDTSRHSSSRHKKSKRRHDKYRSPSPDRRRRKRSRSRRRSRSADSYRRRSPSSPRSRSRYSRSRSRDRRSRSHDRRRRSRSRGRRSRSGSWSNSRTGSQRSSEERRWDNKASATASPSTTALKGLSIQEQVFEGTPSQIAEQRLRLALKAAAAADEKIKLRSLQQEDSPQDGSALRDSGDFADRVKEIESERFVASSFSSSRSNRPTIESSSEPSHDAAIFGSLSTEGFVIQPDLTPTSMAWDTDSLMHPSLFCDVEEKMDHWVDRLTQLRRRKLEGEAL